MFQKKLFKDHLTLKLTLKTLNYYSELQLKWIGHQPCRGLALLRAHSSMMDEFTNHKP